MQINYVIFFLKLLLAIGGSFYTFSIKAENFNGWDYKVNHEDSEFKHRLDELKTSYEDNKAVNSDELAALIVASISKDESQYFLFQQKVAEEVSSIQNDMEMLKSGWLKVSWLDSIWINHLKNANSELEKSLFLRVFIDQFSPKVNLGNELNYAVFVLLNDYSSQLDIDNTQWLKNTIEQHGWFDISKYSEAASQGAWLIVQHSDFEPDWQKQMLKLLHSKVESGDFQGKYYAYLADRVATNADEPQVFGTQGFCNEDKRWVFFEISDRSNVEERREAIGLEPLEEYRKKFRCR